MPIYKAKWDRKCSNDPYESSSFHPGNTERTKRVEGVRDINMVMGEKSSEILSLPAGIGE